MLKMIPLACLMYEVTKISKDSDEQTNGFHRSFEDREQ